MLAPRFVDQYTAQAPQRNNRSFQNLIGPLKVDRAGLDGHRDLSQLDEQTKHFTYWTYIAIRRACEKIASQKPHFGTIQRGSGQRQSIQSARHIRQSYGYTQAADEEMTPVPDTHPLVRLIEHVNPEDTWYEFAYESWMFLELTGLMYWLVVPNSIRTNTAPGGLPAELWCLPPHWVEPVYDKRGQLTAWKVRPYMDEGRMQIFPPDWIIKARQKNPRSKIDPYSALQAGARWIDSVETIEKSREAGYANGVNPDLIVTLDPDKYTKAPEQSEMDRIRARFRQRHQGLEQFNGGPLIMPPGMDVSPWSRAPKEMDFIESAAQARDFNLALLATPPVIAGISSDYTRATAEAAQVVYCDTKINPGLRFLAAVMTEKLCPRFDSRIKCWYEDCTPGDAEYDLKRKVAASQNAGFFPNEWRSELGLERINEPAYNTGYIGGGQVPLSAAAQQAASDGTENEPLPPDPETEDDAPEDDPVEE